MVHKVVSVTYMIHKAGSVPNSKLYDIQEFKNAIPFFRLTSSMHPLDKPDLLLQ
jgi:hypothetical protein